MTEIADGDMIVTQIIDLQYADANDAARMLATMKLGGMLKLNQSKGGNKVPILGDIPLIGALFRGVANSDIQNKLYVFVRAEIIRPEETLATLQDTLKRISEQNRQAFEQHESEFQQVQSVPGMKAKPTEPGKVLDAQ